MKANAAYQFERRKRLHETRKSAGLLNRLTPARWRLYHDDRINRDTVRMVEPLARHFDRPVVLTVGGGGGGLLKLTWTTPGILRIGVDINHDVLVDEGRHHFLPVEGSASLLPIRDAAVDILLFDYVLHHLVGQGVLEESIREAARVVRGGGYLVAREPSAFSPSGLAMNVANRFRLMHLLSGASNYEFAISPPRLLKLFSSAGAVETVHGLSFCWSRRLPVRAQRVIQWLEPYLFAGARGPWFADFILYIIRKDGREGGRTRPRSLASPEAAPGRRGQQETQSLLVTSHVSLGTSRLCYASRSSYRVQEDAQRRQAGDQRGRRACARGDRAGPGRRRREW